MFPAFLGGAVGGVVGAAIWAAVAYFFQYEIGWIAWGIGVLVGTGVAIGTRGEGSIRAGVLAAVLALLSVAGGKYAAVQLFLPTMDDMLAEAVSYLDDEETLKTSMAFNLIYEKEEAGESVAWPEGVDPMLAESAADFPPAVWGEVSARWDAMTDDERAAYRADMEAEFTANAEIVYQMMGSVGFLASFGAMDLLFLGLAVYTAFQIAARTPQSEEEPETEEPAEAPAPASVA